MDNKERDKKEILRLVAEYCNKYHKPKAFCEGDKIHYAARVYGEEEMTNLVDSALDFWLTSGEYTEKFENDFAAFSWISPFRNTISMFRCWKERCPLRPRR